MVCISYKLFRVGDRAGLTHSVVGLWVGNSGGR